MSPLSELTLLGDDELEGRLAESRRELLNLRFQLATGQLDNAARIGQVRREVARLLTLLRQREIAAAEGVVFTPPAPAPAEKPARAKRAAKVADEAPAAAEPVDADPADGPQDEEEEA